MNHRLAAMLLSLPLAVPAQQDPERATTGHSRPEPVVVSMQFSGGTMAEFVAALRSSQPKANVVLANQARDAVVPAMVLKGAGIEQALSGAAMAAEADFEVRVKEFRGEGEPVFSIVAYERPRQVVAGVAGPDPKAEQQAVFSLNELTGAQPFDVEPFSVETILGALRLATEGEQNPPRIRFHEDSGLLLVRGTHAQMGVVQMTLSTMRQDLNERQSRKRELEQQRRQREAEAAVKKAAQDR